MTTKDYDYDRLRNQFVVVNHEPYIASYLAINS